MILIPALEKLHRQAHDPAVIDASGELDWQALFAGALGFVQLLRDRDLGSGVHVAILAANRAEYYQALLGALLGGVWLTPVNTHLSDIEIDYVLGDSESAMLFTAGHEYSHKLTIPVCDLCTVDLQTDKNTPEQLYRQVRAMLEQPPGGTLMYTSGTTGKPKGVKRAAASSVGRTLENWCRLGRDIGLDGTGCHLVTGPVYHAAPGLYALYDLLNGASVLLMESFDCEQCLSLIEQYQVTHTHLVPTCSYACCDTARSWTEIINWHRCSWCCTVLHRWPRI